MEYPITEHLAAWFQKAQRQDLIDVGVVECDPAEVEALEVEGKTHHPRWTDEHIRSWALFSIVTRKRMSKAEQDALGADNVNGVGRVAGAVEAQTREFRALKGAFETQYQVIGGVTSAVLEVKKAVGDARQETQIQGQVNGKMLNDVLDIMKLGAESATARWEQQGITQANAFKAQETFKGWVKRNEFWTWVWRIAILLALLGILALNARAQQPGSQITVIRFTDDVAAPIATFAAPFTIQCLSNLTCTKTGSVLSIQSTGGSGMGCTTSGSAGQIVYDDGMGGCGSATQFVYSGSTITGTSGTLNLTGMTLVTLRSASSLTTSTNGDVGYDSAAKFWHIWQDGSDRLLIASTNVGVAGQAFLSGADGSGTFADPIVSGPDAPGAAQTANPVAGLAGIDYTTDCSGGPCVQEAKVTATGQVLVTGAGGTFPVTGPLTDTELRATPVPISGTVTATTGGLTDTQLRATPVPISGTVTVTDGSGALNVIVDSGTITTITNQVDTNVKQVGGQNTLQGDQNNVASATGAITVGPIGRYNATQPTLTDTRYNLFQLTSRGELIVSPGVSGFAISGAKSNNAVVPGTTNLGVLPSVASNIPPTYTNTFQTTLATDLNGGLRVNLGQDRDAFGQFVSTSRYGQWEVNFSAGADATVITASQTGSGSITYANGGVTINTTAATSSSSKVISPQTLRYQVGFEWYAIFTASFTAGRANSHERVGIYNATDGFFIGWEGATWGVSQFLASAGQGTFVANTAPSIALASFNGDQCTGAAGSAFTSSGSPVAIDMTKINVYRLRGGWLGAGVVILEVLSPDGNWVTMHTYHFPDTLTASYTANTTWNYTAETLNTTNATAMSMFMGGAAFGSSDAFQQLSTTLDGTAHALPTKSAVLGQYNAVLPTVTTGNFAYEQLDVNGRQIVTGGLTNNNAVPAATHVGALTALANAASPTNIEGNETLLSTALNGGLRVVGTVSNNAAAPVAVQQLGVLPATALTTPPSYTDGRDVKLVTNTAGSLRTVLDAETTKVIGTVNQGTSPWVVGDGSGSLNVIVDSGAIGLAAATTGGCTPNYFLSAASTNATVIKNAAGTLCSIYVVNTTATIYYLKFYNVSSGPTCNSDTPVQIVGIPANTAGAGIAVNVGPYGWAFGTGIGACLTGGSAANDNSNAATGLQINYSYK